MLVTSARGRIPRKARAANRDVTEFVEMLDEVTDDSLILYKYEF